MSNNALCGKVRLIYRPVFIQLVSGVAAATLASSVLPASAFSETLRQALAQAYSGNPAIAAERARQRSTDEQVPQALSGWRPTIIASADAGVKRASVSSSSGNRNTTPAGMSIELSQPVFRGFKTINEVKRAEANVEAGRQSLLAVEQQVLFDAASAFMNVVRDRQIAALRKRTVSFLQQQLRAARERMDAGLITGTDVAQSRARLSLALSNLAMAQASKQTSAANYWRLVGRQPEKLSGARILYRLPRTLRQAISVAGRKNPTVLAALHLEEASRHNIEAVKGDLLPTVSLQARYQFREQPSSSTSNTQTASVLGIIQVPLYQAGRVYSQVREAKQLSSQRQLLTLDTRRRIREVVVNSWHALIATRQTSKSFADQVNANQLALDGVRQEAHVGSRTTLDVLDAEQELVESRVSLARARSDAVVAAYRVLASIGSLTAENLRLPVPIYDPDEHYGKIRNRLFGTGGTTRTK